MTQIKTPAEAIKLAGEALEFLPGLGESVIRGSDLQEFLQAADVAKKLCLRQPSPEICLAIEECLGLMGVLFLEAPLLKAKPQLQVQAVLDCYEIAGVACHEAGTGRLYE